MLLEQITLIGNGATIVLGDLTFDEDSNATGYTIDRADLDPADYMVRKEDLPLAYGGVVTQGPPTYREVSITGMVLGTSATHAHELRRELVACLRGQVSIRYTPEADELELIGRLDGSIDFSEAGGPYLSYQMKIACADPVAYKVEASSAEIATTPGTECMNEGDGPVWPSFSFEVTSGTVTGAKVTNSTSGRYLELTGLSLTTGDVIEITSQPGYEDVLIEGVSSLDKLTLGSRFFDLRPGVNTLIKVITGGGADVTAGWRSGWVS